MESKNLVGEDNCAIVVVFVALIVGLIVFFSVKDSKAHEKYNDLTVSKVISVYDGDTFRVNIDNIRPLLGQNIAIRVNGVDTPEIRGKCLYEKNLAITARNYVRSRLNRAKEIRLTDISRGKYFRIVADVIIDGKSLTKALLDRKLGYAYEGGRKQSWCD